MAGIIISQPTGEVYCDLTLGGVAKDCSGNVGGVSRIYIAAAKDIKSITIDENGIVTAITPVTSTAKPFHNYWARKATAVYNTTFNVSETSDGTYTNTLLFQIQKLNGLHRKEFLNLTAGETIVIFMDNNGVYHLLGTPVIPATGTAGDGTTGQALTDYNGYTVTLGTTDSSDAPEVDPSIVDDLIATAA